MRIAFSLNSFLSKVNCKYYHDGCMVTGVRSTMEEHEERFCGLYNDDDNDTDDYKLMRRSSVNFSIILIILIILMITN